MILIPERHVCPDCFGYTGYPGERARKSDLRKHLACQCEEAAEQLTECLPDPLLNKRRAA